MTTTKAIIKLFLYMAVSAAFIAFGGFISVEIGMDSFGVVIACLTIVFLIVSIAAAFTGEDIFYDLLRHFATAIKKRIEHRKNMLIYEELKQLKALFDSEIITEEEFKARSETIKQPVF